MRRRQRVDPASLPPAELRTFTPEFWQDLELTDGPASPHEVPGYRAWADARAAWRDQHGWPTDSIDYFLEQRAERLRASGWSG